MLNCLGAALDPYQRSLQLARDFWTRDDQGAAAIRDETAVQTVQRIADHRRIDHVLDGDQLAQHGVGIVLGMMGSRDLDPGELLAGGAEFMHVAHRRHGV